MVSKSCSRYSKTKCEETGGCSWNSNENKCQKSSKAWLLLFLLAPLLFLRGGKKCDTSLTLSVCFPKTASISISGANRGPVIVDEFIPVTKRFVLPGADVYTITAKAKNYIDIVRIVQFEECDERGFCLRFYNVGQNPIPNQEFYVCNGVCQ